MPKKQAAPAMSHPKTKTTNKKTHNKTTTTTTTTTTITKTITTVTTESHSVCPECGELSINDLTLCLSCEEQESKLSKGNRRLLEETDILEDPPSVIEFLPPEALDMGLLQNE